MEAIGLVASVAQISAYAFSILETMQKIRSLARDGPDQLREKVEHLDLLLVIVGRIEGNQRLRDEAIARYLASIQKKIRRLLDAVKSSLSKLGARTFKGLLAAIHIISNEKLIDASFTSISQDCNTLALHIMSSGEEVSTSSSGKTFMRFAHTFRSRKDGSNPSCPLRGSPRDSEGKATSFSRSTIVNL